MGCIGDPIHAEVSSADASGGVAFKLFRSGSTDEYTLDPKERIVITDVMVVAAAGGSVAIVADTDADGRRVLKGEFAINGGASIKFHTPYACPLGVTPKIIADAGQIDAQFNGYIVRS